MDPEQFIKAGNKVKYWQSRMREHLEANPQLRRQYNREKNRYNSRESVKEKEEALKAEAKRAKIKEIKDFIQSNAQPKTIEPGKQGKHILGHNNYISGRSYLTISADEAQALVDQYAGTGKPEITKGLQWKNKETIRTKHIIGMDVDQVTGMGVETTDFKIHYSKKGVHIVPYKEK